MAPLTDNVNKQIIGSHTIDLRPIFSQYLT